MFLKLWTRGRTGQGRFLTHPEWHDFLGHVEAAALMNMPVTDRYHAKQGRSTGRLVFHRDGRTLVVYLKRHFHFTWLERLQAWIAPQSAWSPAWLEWKHLQWAREHGIPVPDALAVGQWRGPRGRCQSYLALRELTGQLSLNEWLPHAVAIRPRSEAPQWWRSLIRELARLVRIMHDAHHYHQDLYLCHFYAPLPTRDDPPRIQPGQISMIDFHRLGHHPITGFYWRIKDLAQLLYSSFLPEITDRDRWAFFRAYLNVRKFSNADRRLARWVALKAKRYLNHNQAKTFKPTLPMIPEHDETHQRESKPAA